MSEPTYDELLNRHGIPIDGSLMELPFENDHRNELASILESCTCELLIACLQIPNSESENIMMGKRDAITRIIMVLDFWKRRHGPSATFGRLVKALMKVKAIDSADKVVAFTSTLSVKEKALEMPAVPAHQTQSTSSMALSPSSPSSPSQAQVTTSLQQLEEEFLMLVIDIEVILEENNVQVIDIAKRFRMLPQSIRRRQETDSNYETIRQQILDSRTIKELFNHLTALKHWSFMMPETLAHILKGVEIDQVHKKIAAYRSKLSDFKGTTKLKDMINTTFALPDYCIELTMKVNGWEDKTIEEVEQNVVNMIYVPPSTNISGKVCLGWKSVGIGCIRLTFILMESIGENLPKLCCDEKGVVSIHIDGTILYKKECTSVEEGKSPLVRAAELGDEMAVLKLLDDGADVDLKQEPSGKTALLFAAENGHLATTTILLSYGADAYQTDAAGENAYKLAKKKGHTKVCEELQLFESGRVPQVRTISTQQRIMETIGTVRDAVLGKLYQVYHWMTSDLIGAARSGDIQAVMYMLEHSKDVKALVQSRESDKHGWTALMYACDGGNYKIVKLLLDKGADPNDAAKSNGWSSLMLASRREQLRIMRTLLDYGADPNLQNNIGISALPIALYEKRTAAALLLIHRGANIHLPDNNGWTPLMRASNEGNLKLVKVISDLGADLNAQTEEGWSALMVATSYGYTDVVKELAHRGAELDLKTNAGDAALHIATIRNNCSVAEVLIDLKADLEITNKDGLTALMVATSKNYEKIVEALVRGGANVNHPHEATNWTAIFFAGTETSAEIIQTLLRQGALYTLSDGTSLINVMGHLKDKVMQIVSDLGTSVDSIPKIHEDNMESQNVSYTARSLALKEFVFALEERFKRLV